MATYNLRRFSHAEGLKVIGIEHLLALLNPHKAYFEGRGLRFPLPSSSADLDYDQLVEVLMSPDTSTPSSLLDALYYVHEMSTPEAMDVLLQEAEDNGISLDGKPDPTPADVAVQVYLKNKDLLERKHAEQYLNKPRSFEYFQTDAKPIPKFKKLTAKTLTALKKELDDWFEKKKRGRCTRVFVYPKADAVWFLVHHGDPFKREGSLDGEKTSSVFYRPEKYDVLVYEPDIGEMRMHACSRAEKELYRRQFGWHLFGNENFFPGTGKYTLEPLRNDGEACVVCTDVVGMEWVRLKEIQFLWGGAEKEIEIRKANDLFAAYSATKREMPKKARILRASFQVMFTGANAPRTVTIRPSNIAQYTRDNDATVVEEWLTKRGFVIAEDEEDEK